MTSPMPDLDKLETAQLIDLLAERTAIVTKMVYEKKFSDEYEKQKLLLKAIQAEIDFRKNTADTVTTNVTTPPGVSQS